MEIKAKVLGHREKAC